MSVFIIIQTAAGFGVTIIVATSKELGHASADDIIAECDLKKRRYPGRFNIISSNF